MKQRQFELAHEAAWRQFEQALDAQANKRRDASGNAAFLRHYRLVCRDLALAEARGYSTGLVQRLNSLAIRGHNLLYTRRSGVVSGARAFLLRDFPRLVRAEWRFVLVAALLFFVPGLVVAGAIAREPSTVYLIASPQEVHNFEQMYQPGATPGQSAIGERRHAGDDFAMFGFYIRNNIGVGFQCFASGVLFGVGPVYYLAFNGASGGAVAAHLTGHGLGRVFFPFVIGHSAFEITAIVISGAAGLKLGMALLRPGRQRRSDALVAHGRIAVRLVFGAFVMLVIAAFLESFWSARSLVPGWARLTVGAVLWSLVFAYFLFSGRRGAPA